ncbi:D-aminoacylase [Desulfobacula sp.]|uniref:N-acyl-D-amino-acid deacylase family protein n=1 Tax=Desulfobacula sp. TaxID=2593537 RepID=UPI002604DAA4|nr:D-aminoacylase [Desulfobacula sp.]
MKLLIKNGTIIDGTGNPGVQTDIAVSGTRISAIGSIPPEGFDRIMDARGKVVCPGFIDTHSHSDLQILLDPQVPPKIYQGITTEILGQDGIAMAPLPVLFIESWRKNLAGLSGETDAIDWTYETTAGYLGLLENRGLAPNAGYLVPHGNVRMEAMGLGNTPATSRDLETMKTILNREMDAGALGLSTGLIYIPCAYADTRELIELCRVVAHRDGVFVIHQRSEADGIISSMEEVIRIGEESGVKIHFSHMKVCGKDNWDKLPLIFKLLDEAADKGVRISFDQYPYVAGSTMLGAILPPWAHEGGTERLLERLSDPALREKMIRQITSDKAGWDNFVSFAGLSGIFITSTKTRKNQAVIGKNLVEIGEMTGKDPLEAALDLLLEEENAVGMVDFYGKEDHVVEFLCRPEQNVCTDGLLGGKPHPRVYGAFPRVISEYVRKRPVLTMEMAVHKMTGKPAKVFHLEDRGLLKKGHYADILIFDPDTICDRGTYEVPDQFPDGICMVMVNGSIVLENGTLTQNLPGHVLRMNQQA